MRNLDEVVREMSEVYTTLCNGVYDSCVCDDGGLTMYGSDELSRLGGDVRQVMTALVNNAVGPELWEKLSTLAYPGWDEDTGEILPENDIAAALLNAAEESGAYR